MLLRRQVHGHMLGWPPRVMPDAADGRGRESSSKVERNARTTLGMVDDPVYASD